METMANKIKRENPAWYLDIACEQRFNEILLEIAILITLYNIYVLNRRCQAVSIYKYFLNTCSFILSNAKLIDFIES